MLTIKRKKNTFACFSVHGLLLLSVRSDLH